MKSLAIALCIAFLGQGSLSIAQTLKVLPPAQGAYHGAFADFGGAENEVTKEKIRHFEELSGKKLVWAYFSDHWLNETLRFPKENVSACVESGVIPYIRMSPWNELRQNQANLISMQKIIDGQYDDGLTAWAADARDTHTAIMIEFGPEVNGRWFPWNGIWNGGATKSKYGDPKWPDGPERFRDAYIHVVELFRKVGANNITWVLHVDSNWEPEESWNKFKNYYPGDEYIDWVGVSVFGRQLPKYSWVDFREPLKTFLTQVTPVTGKPILISEFAVIEDQKRPVRKATWIKSAFEAIKSDFPQIKGMTYWHSPGWIGAEASFEIDSSSEALRAYKEEVSDPYWLDQAIVGE